MKKHYRNLKSILLLGTFVVVNVMCAQIVAAQVIGLQGRTPGFSKGLSFGVARFFDGDLGTGLSGRVFLEYAPYIHEIALRLSGGYLHFRDEIELGYRPFNSEEEVTFDNLYATGGAIYRLSRGKIVPFLTANLGVYHYRKEDASPASGPIIGGVQLSPFDKVKTVTGNTFGFNIGGGIEYFMSKNTSMSLEMLMHSIQGEVGDQIFDLTVMFRFLP